MVVSASGVGLPAVNRRDSFRLTSRLTLCGRTSAYLRSAAMGRRPSSASTTHAFAPLAIRYAWPAGPARVRSQREKWARLKPPMNLQDGRDALIRRSMDQGTEIGSIERDCFAIFAN